MPPRHLLQISRTLPWQEGGDDAALHAWRLCQAFRRRGWQVDLLTTSLDGVAATQERDHVRIHQLPHLPLNRRDVPSKHWWRRFAVAVDEYVLDHRIRAGVVHAEGNDGHRLFRRLRQKEPPVIRVSTLHTSASLAPPLPETTSLLQRWERAFHSQIERRRRLPTAQRIVATSEPLAQHLSRVAHQAADRIEVIPFGAAAPHPMEDRQALRSRLGLPIDLRLLLYIGPLDGRANLSSLLEHLKTHPRDRLVVAGSGPEAASLRKAAQELPNPASLRLLPPPTEDLRQRMLAAADMVVWPRNEIATPAVVLDGLASGVPAYVPHAWVSPDLRGHVANQADTTDGIEAAHAKSERVRAQRGQVLHEHGWDRVAERYEQAFDRALGRR